jgi:hypothetical protein
LRVKSAQTSGEGAGDFARESACGRLLAFANIGMCGPAALAEGADWAEFFGFAGAGMKALRQAGIHP